MPRRRELQRRTTEQHILAAALRLFSAHGYDATTTKQIAEAAGVAHGTVFLVAATKEALLVRALEQGLRAEFAARAAALPARNLERQLLHLFDGLFDFYAERPALSRVFLRAIVFPAEPVAEALYQEHVAQLTTYLASLVGGAVQRGELAAAAPSRTAASNVMAIYVYALISYVNDAGADRDALGRRFRAGLRTLLDGLR
ncbi:MAG: TetR/AcrR family transcriptional regulator [Deltaproteobacteria bacterium]|nr:TetR/AcrR family transcriptional regulator [Deltaproteobacteria bacterium]